MIARKKIVLIIGILAFAAAVCFLFFQRQRANQGGKGLSHFTVETLKGEHGWGYRIRQDTTAVIEQKVIPGVPGVNGFDSEQQAKKIGELVKQKLDQGIFPPTVSTAELDSIGIRY